MKICFRHLLCLLAFVLGSASVAFAQNTVTGTVEDADGPLIGASVLVKGTTRGTITDFDGNYSIEANIGDELEFSYMGYSAQTIAVNGNTIRSDLNRCGIASCENCNEGGVRILPDRCLNPACKVAVTQNTDSYHSGYLHILFEQIITLTR